MHTRTEMLDLVVKDGRAVGIVTRNLITGAVQSWSAHAVVLCTGGYGNAYYLSTNAKASNVTAVVAGAQARRAVRQPVLHPDPPHVHPAQRRLPVEADADVGVVAQRRPGLGAEAARRRPLARPDPRRRPRLLPRAAVPRVRQPRAARRRLTCDQDRGRRRAGRRPAEERRVPRLRRVDRAPRRRRHRGALREPLRDVRAHHRREPVQGARCASTPPSTTRWAGSGSTTT